MNDAIIGILDYDAKGTTGRGTIFWMEITLGGVMTRHEWGLLDELEGRFNKKETLKEYHAAAAKNRAEQEQLEKDARKAALDKRADAADLPDSAMVIIDAVISAETKTVAEYRAGKDKAINALVGKVVVELKKVGGSFDAMVLNKSIRKKLDV